MKRRHQSTHADPRRRVALAGAIFGYIADPSPARRPCPPALLAIARQIHADLPPGGVALVTGPSGCGKSTVLRAVHALAGPRAGIHMPAVPAPLSRSGTRAALINLLPLPLDPAIRLLASVGLAEPALFSRSLDQLSDGQRHRAALAAALARAAPRRRSASRASTLTVDEFASVLDRLGAALLAQATRRLFRTGSPASPRLVVATAHDDLAPYLRPDLLVRLPPDDRS